MENANRLIKQVKLCLIITYKVDWSSKARNVHKVQIRPLARRISVLHPRLYTSNSVDDKIHFLITCFYFATQRTSLLAESKLHNTEFYSL